MVKVRAKIKLYSGGGKRKTPFKSGYRPLFNVLEKTLVSGMITLLDREDFKPGDEGVVEINFLEADCSEGTRFFFYEGVEPLGEGFIVDAVRE
ncbi:hypothetical protein [Alloalcanivorax marinus]|uniref:hypothetical protein n=1 Tax=Alloalcanivorax marinus TaxID=1177169 RepID=UPI001931FEFA|nr:hypothetical protein [Alloalcanivorax marinus]MBL7249127.1 hypothetical protein [Alloalcanivorax marinus]